MSRQLFTYDGANDKVVTPAQSRVNSKSHDKSPYRDGSTKDGNEYGDADLCWPTIGEMFFCCHEGRQYLRLENISR